MRKNQMMTLVMVACMQALACSCSKCEEINDGEIRFSAVEETAVKMTKAPVNPSDAFRAQIVGSLSPGDYSIPYVDGKGTELDMAADFSAEVSPTNNQRTVTLPSRVYYPSSGEDVFVTCYSPVEEAGKVIRDRDVVEYKAIDGNQDILFGTEISGNKSSMEPLELNLEHVLSQVNILVKVKESGFEKIWGKITKVELLNIPSHLELNLLDGTIQPAFDPQHKNISIYSNSQGFTMSSSFKNIGIPVMICNDALSFDIRITTESKTVTLTSSVELLPGMTNNIMITFNSRGINLSAILTEWMEGPSENLNVI